MAYQLKLQSAKDIKFNTSGGNALVRFRIYDTNLNDYIGADKVTGFKATINISKYAFSCDNTLAWTDTNASFRVYAKNNLYNVEVKGTVTFTVTIDATVLSTTLDITQAANTSEPPFTLLTNTLQIPTSTQGHLYELSYEGVGEHHLPIVVKQGVTPRADIEITYNHNTIGSMMVNSVMDNDLGLYFNENNTNIDLSLEIIFTYKATGYQDVLYVTQQQKLIPYTSYLDVSSIELPSYNTEAYIKDIYLTTTNDPEIISVYIPDSFTEFAKPTISLAKQRTNYFRLRLTWAAGTLVNYEDEDKIADLPLLFESRDSETDRIVNYVKLIQRPFASVTLISDSSIALDGNSHYNITFDCDFSDYRLSNTRVVTPDWITGYVDVTNRCIILANVTMNQTSGTRTANITALFEFIDASGTTITRDINITVTQARASNFAVPSWKQIGVDVLNSNVYRIQITEQDSLIAYLTYNNVVRSIVDIAPIIRPYINKQTLTFDKDVITDYPIKVQVFNDTWQLFDSTIYYNYTYDNDFEHDNEFISDSFQATPYFVEGQYILTTVQDFYNEEISPVIDIKNDKGVIISTLRPGNTGSNTQDTLITPAVFNSEEVIIHDENYPTRTFTYKKTCKDYKYCLYYLNPAGGWNWMLFDGKEVPSITTKAYSVPTNNEDNEAHVIKNYTYLIDSTKQYKLTTGYLSDTQSKKFINIIKSPLVYLHDLTKKEVIACEMVTTNLSEQSFKSNGRKFNQYTIDVKEQLNKKIRL